MQKLKFFAREDELVFVPYITVSPGAPERYVGRRFEPRLRGYPATKAPFECEANSDTGRRLLLLATRDKSLFPADEDTAKACGLKKAPELKYASGAWVLKSSPLPEGELELPEVEPVIAAEEVKPVPPAKATTAGVKS